MLEIQGLACAYGKIEALREVLRHLRELLEQLIGVEAFVLYLGSAEGTVQPVSCRTKAAGTDSRPQKALYP